MFWIFTALWNTPKAPSPPNLGFTRFRPLSHHWFSYRREPSGLFTRSLPPSLGLRNAVGENQRLSSFESRGEICNLNCNWWGSLIKPKRVLFTSSWPITQLAWQSFVYLRSGVKVQNNKMAWHELSQLQSSVSWKCDYSLKSLKI